MMQEGRRNSSPCSSRSPPERRALDELSCLKLIFATQPMREQLLDKVSHPVKDRVVQFVDLLAGEHKGHTTAKT